ncbi:MAG: hypothetical protein IT282_05325, partial [Bacteroidetes bacterium]|nr:hypothetical protein [Bacteroidota bacterium]
FLGCSNKEKEEALQAQLSQAEADRQSYQTLLSERDKYVEGVIKEINDIYADLESTRVKEGKLKAQPSGSEGKTTAEDLDTRKQLLANIASIGDALKENRKRISDLRVRLKKSQGEIASLTKLVENLQATVLEREQSIAQLQAQVVGLEETVQSKTLQLAERDQLLDEQRRKMNAAYYVAAPREELEEKGIITEEGGFLWGLLGSTTVMTSNWDPSAMSSLDRTTEKTIHVPGKISQILPARNADLFAMAEIGENETELTILQPEKFWKENYLVVVLD